MLWQNHFSQTILIRGRDYFRRGKVQNLECNGDAYVAKVVGTRTYTVTVTRRRATVRIHVRAITAST